MFHDQQGERDYYINIKDYFILITSGKKLVRENMKDSLNVALGHFAR